MYWVEIRCNKRGDNCLSHSNDDVGDGCYDNLKRLKECVMNMGIEARKLGWVKIDGVGWICPACKDSPDK